MFCTLLWLTPFKVNAQAASPVGIAVGGDNLTRLLWNNPNSTISLWTIAADGSVATQNSYGPYPGWSATALSTGPDNFARVLCTHPSDGLMSLWRVNPSSAALASTSYGPYPGWNTHCLTVGGDNAPRLLWNHPADGVASLWKIAADGTFTAPTYGPYAGYTASLVAAGPNSIPRTLWNKSDGSISLWYSTADAANYAHTEYGPFAGYAPVALAVDSTNAPRVLWNHPSDGMVSLWKVAANGTYTYQNFTDPTGYSPVALAAGTGGDVRLLWSNGEGGALVWTIQAGGAYVQTYPNPNPYVTSITVSPSTITAGGTARATVTLSGPAPSGATVDIINFNAAVVHVSSSVSVANSSSVSFPVTTSAGTYDYTNVELEAVASQNYTSQPTTLVTVYTPGGIATGGGGTGGGGTGGGGTGTGGGGTGTGGGGTGGGGTGGGGTGGGGTGGGGTGGGGTATAGVNPHGYYSVTYDYSDGGSHTPSGSAGITTPTAAYDPVYGDYVDTGDVHFSGPFGTGTSAYMTGTFIANFTWHGDAAHPNSPPPAQVTVIKRSIASWGASYYTNVTNVFGSSNTGLTLQHTSASNPNNSDSLTEFGYETKGGATFSVTCRPSASVGYTTNVALPPGNASAYARISFTAAAVVMNLAGTTLNKLDNSDAMLIGQRCTASLQGSATSPPGVTSPVSGIPTGLASNLQYAWGIPTGTIFQQWRPTTPLNGNNPPDTNASYYDPGPGPLTLPTYQWHWNDPVAHTETVTGTVALTPPPGQGAAFSLTLPPQTINVQLPTFKASNAVGNGYVGPYNNSVQPTLYVGPNPPMIADKKTQGSTWRTSVTMPAAPTYSDPGFYGYAQLVTPGE